MMQLIYRITNATVLMTEPTDHMFRKCSTLHVRLIFTVIYCDSFKSNQIIY